jgi:hypothetical protein
MAGNVQRRDPYGSHRETLAPFALCFASAPSAANSTPRIYLSVDASLPNFPLQNGRGPKRGRKQTLIKKTHSSTIRPSCGPTSRQVPSTLRRPGKSWTANIPSLEGRVPYATLALVIVVGYAASLLTTFLPARQASNVYPAEALRYE